MITKITTRHYTTEDLGSQFRLKPKQLKKPYSNDKKHEMYVSIDDYSWVDVTDYSNCHQRKLNTSC